MSRTNPCPNKCLSRNPTSKSIYFCGYFISLTELAKVTGFNHGHLSRIFSGKRKPSFQAAAKIAAGLGMSLDEFHRGLEFHLYKPAYALTA